MKPPPRTSRNVNPQWIAMLISGAIYLVLGLIGIVAIFRRIGRPIGMFRTQALQWMSPSVEH